MLIRTNQSVLLGVCWYLELALTCDLFLQSFYKKAKIRFDEDPAFKERAQKAVVLLQVFVMLFVACNLLLEISPCYLSRMDGKIWRWFSSFLN